MTCILRAGGADLDVDAFLAGTSFTIHSCWRKGERRFPQSKTNQDVNATSGIRIVTSDADPSAFAQQLDDVASFLDLNLAGLQRLSSFPGVEWALLDSGAEIMPPGWASFSFPVGLLRLAGAAGVALCLSVYPTDEDGGAQAEVRRLR